MATYNAGARPAQLVAVVALIQASYIGPRFARLHHDGNLDGLSRLSRSATTTAGAWAAACCVVVVLAPQPVLSVFGDYGQAAPILQVLSVGTALVTLIGPAAQVLLVTGREHVAGRYTLTALTLSAVALPPLAVFGDTVMVAVGAAIASLLFTVLCWVHLARRGIRVGVLAGRTRQPSGAHPSG